jgi:hypothetical protein
MIQGCLSKMAITDILHLIDIRIEELQQARSILAACVPSKTAKPRRATQRIEQTEPEPVAAVPVVVVSARKPRERRTRVVQPSVSAPSALTSSVPTAPVIVSAAEAAAVVASRLPQVQKQPVSPGAWLLEG